MPQSAPLPPAAIKTPYLPNGKFDLDAYDAIVEQQIANGVEVRSALLQGGRRGSSGSASLAHSMSTGAFSPVGAAWSNCYYRIQPAVCRRGERASSAAALARQRRRRLAAWPALSNPVLRLLCALCRGSSLAAPLGRGT